MKTSDKFIVGLFLAIGLLCVSGKSEAGSLPRSPKDIFVSTGTTGAYKIVGSTFEASGQSFPGAIYQVTMSTGASGEFVVFYDTNSCTGLTATTNNNTALTAPAKTLTPRLMFGSTTAGSTFAFDPPLIFQNGLCAFDSAATGQFGVTLEIGRGLSGN